MSATIEINEMNAVVYVNPGDTVKVNAMNATVSVRAPFPVELDPRDDLRYGGSSDVPTAYGRGAIALFRAYNRYMNRHQIHSYQADVWNDVLVPFLEEHGLEHMKIEARQ